VSLLAYWAKVILGIISCIIMLWGVIFFAVAVYMAARALVRAVTGRPRVPADGRRLSWQERRTLRALRRDLERQDAYQPATYDQRRGL
jgi:hypothetical protein